MAVSQVETAKAFVDWLESSVVARGGSWRSLADAAGVSASSLSALRTGKSGRPSMETCYRLAHHLGVDAGFVLGLAGYTIGQEKQVDIADPELDLMFHGLMELSAEEREPVKEFVRYALAKAAARRSRRGGGRRRAE